ncbi:protein kinase domain-containing protein [Gimesia sp.]|uniref:protein kinase domain-containing protein n=1 Tax=Gimesia sp. TaxID=2024833 RepID=UPI003A912396
MNTSTELFRLDEAVVVDEYVDALFGELKSFLQKKNPGHCQRIDYLPRDVMNRLGQRLADDTDLQSAKVVCRVVTDKPEHADHESWESSGSGAVAFREDATYGRIRVFCAMFPAGIRLAEEDSLNVATFKTDDALSFNVRRCLDTHVRAKVNMLPEDERKILDAILKEEAVRQLDVRLKLRYVLSVLGQKESSNQPVNWETAGAYLYELKMIPDFKLESENLPVQLTRNQMCAAILSDGDKSLTQNLDRLVTEKGLDDEERRRDLAVFLSDKDMMQPDQWLPDICHDDTARERLSFDEWHFSEPTTGVSIELSPLQNPNTSKVTKGLIYQNGALVNDGKKPIQIRWTVKPTGTKDVGGYRIYVVRNTEDEGEVDVIMPQALSGKRVSFMVPIADNNLDDDEKCVVRIRIQALNKNGVPLQDASDESEEFWIENGEEITPPPPDRGKRLRHLKEVAFRATHKTGKTYDVRSRGWDAKRDYVYALRLTNNDRGDLALNPLLRDLEREILLNPNNLGVYEANIIGKRTAQLADFHEIELSDSINTMANDFFEARSAFFTAVRELEDGTGIVEITDLHTIMDESLIYIQKYVELLKKVAEKVGNSTGPGQINNILHDYAAIMRIDTVLMRIGPTEAPMQVLLLSPTHPLRILWLYQYETFVDQWIQKMTGRKPDEIQRLISEDSIDKLINLNIPNAISWEQGQTFINTDNLDLFWSVLPNGNVKDLRTAVNATRQAVGASRQEVVVSTVTPKQIADKIERYLCHHPYVRSLKVNVINPGDGALLLEAIKSLLGKPLYEYLNFDVKFFAPKDTRHELVGDAFDDFMTQRRPEEWTYGGTLSETEERLLQPNENPLFPKLIYAKHNIAELLNDNGGRFESHLTFLIDYFGTTIATRPHTELMGSSSLHNLLAEYVTDYSAGAATATWSRLIAPTECPELASDGNTKRLFQSHNTLSHLSACFYDWADSLEKYTTVQLELTDSGGRHHLKLLRQVHLISDWVFTIDRNFGIEYYDDPKRPAGGESKGYLIDYTPEFLDAVAHRLIISTYHQQEIESILRHGFANLLTTADGQEPVIASHTIGRILQILKSVSGKLALKLINNPNQAQEVIGLALTRLSLERDDRLRGRVLIPVDSHIDLFYQNKKELENSELTLKRNDLMLVELTGSKMTIDLIEVKNRKHSSPQELLDLQTQICEKNSNTEQHFRAHFVGSGDTKRFDSDIKNKELANILLFYFDRARRYGLFETSELDETSSSTRIQAFYKGIEAVEVGACEVSFRHEGFIFNGSALTDQEDRDINNNDIHIVGRVGISEFLGLVIDEEEGTTNTSEDEPGGDSGDGTGPEPEPSPGGIGGQTGSPEPSPSETDTSGDPEVAVATEETGTVPPDEPAVSGETKATSEEPMPSTEGKKGVSTPEKPKDTPVASGDLGAAEVNIQLGKNCVTGQEVYWNPQTKKPRRLTNQHLLVVGKSGSGKSETTKALIWELDRLGVPSIILDYQGEYAFGEFAEAVEPQKFDVMDGLPVNPFELPFDPIANRKRPPIEMIFGLADTLNTVFSGSGDIQLGILREAIEACYVQAGFDFHDPATWELEPPTLEMLEAVLDHMAQDHGTQVRNLQIRLQPLFKSGIFKQQNAGYSFDELFQRTSVILMTSGIKDLMLAASRFILEKVYSTMLMQGVTKQLRVMVVIDEAHKLCGDETIISLVKEARKYGLGLILSSQETRDFHGSVFANTGTLIALGLEDADATVMAKHLGLTDKKHQTSAKELILSQSSGQALVRSQHFLPYAQVHIRSFEDRIEDAEPVPKKKPTGLGTPTGGDPSPQTLKTFQGYKLVQSLDIAGMSEAYIAEKEEDGSQVFLKRVRTHSADKAALEREVRIYEKLLRLQPHYVASVLDFIRDDEYVAIITECADGGDLQTFIESQTSGRGLSPSDAKAIAINLATALKELHDSEVVHRDLKPRNVLCFKGIWKLGDFGIAKNLGRLGTLKTFQQHGTRGYAAPEQFQGVTAHPSADIYSLGKTIVFLLTGQTDIDFVPYTQWADLAKKCIAVKPQDRPTVDKVIELLGEIPT